MTSYSSKISFGPILLFSYLAALPFFAHAELGFKKVGDQPSNSVVATVSKSVFMVTVPSGKKVEIDLLSHPNIESAMESLDDNKYLYPGEILLRKRAIGRCFKAKSNRCSIFSSFEIGTTFLVGDTQTSFSAFHVFRDFLQGQKEQPIDLILQDQTGRIIFGADDSEVAKVAFVYPEVLKDPSAINPLLDFLQLRYSRPIGPYQPLAVNYQDPVNFEGPLFHIGYPVKTYDRQKLFGVPDSDGESQYVTTGKVIKLSEYLRRTGKDPKKIDGKILNFLDQGHLYSDGDSYPGMSGGPTINQKGEVVGIIIGGFPIDGSASDLRVTASIRANWILKVMSDR